MTVAQFLNWDSDDRSGRRWHLVDGHPVAMAPPSPRHAAIHGELAAVIRNHLLDNHSSYRVMVGAGVVPRVLADRNFRIPDLGVTCSPERDGQDMLDPVLLIEIVSPSNEADTRANVWAYASMPSVQEILLLHSTRVGAELLRRGADQTWPANPFTLEGAAVLELTSIGMSVPIRAFYRTTSLAEPRG